MGKEKEQQLEIEKRVEQQAKIDYQLAQFEAKREHFDQLKQQKTEREKFRKEMAYYLATTFNLTESDLQKLIKKHLPEKLI